MRPGTVAGTPLQDAWLFTPSHWQNLLCDSDAGCCPPESLESITDGQLNAELVFRGSSYQKTPGTSYAPFAGPADREERIRLALPGVFGAELRPGRELWAEAPTRDGWMDPQTMVELLACFQRPDLRDTLLCDVMDPELPNSEESGNLLMGRVSPRTGTAWTGHRKPPGTSLTQRRKATGRPC